MTADFEKKLELYAEVIVRVGLNLQPGQRLLIGANVFFIKGAPLESAALVRAVTRKAYQVGARYVEVLWDDEALTRTRFQHAPRDSFDQVSGWAHQLTAEYLRAGDAILAIYASDPDLLKDQDGALVEQAQHALFASGGQVMSLIDKNVSSWLVVSTPETGWSAKVLPDVPESEREAAMWDLILRMSRIAGDDPVTGWHAHIANLQQRAEYLNARQYAALHYTAPGTDLTVGLPTGHEWHSAGLTTQSGIPFAANIPSEEVFTLPHKDRINGTVRATKPLSVGGPLIEDIQLTFKNGRCVEAKASSGEDLLNSMLDTDAGARILGEVALVPHSSPISRSGRLFYNILFDENASNHLALGNGYKFSLAGGAQLSDEEFAARGGNQSVVHSDFMIGSEHMNVNGIRADGSVEPVMRGGEWAFDV